MTFFHSPKVVFFNNLFFYQPTLSIIVSNLLTAHPACKFLSVSVQFKFDLMRLPYGLNKARDEKSVKNHLQLHSQKVMIFYRHLNK